MTCTMNASKTRSTAKWLGRAASDRFCNSCIPRTRPLYNPRSSHFVFRGALNAGGPASHYPVCQFLRKRSGVHPHLQSSRLPRSSPDRRETSPRRLAIRIYRRSIHHAGRRSEEHTSELQSRFELVCRLLPETKKAAATFSPRESNATPTRLATPRHIVS